MKTYKFDFDIEREINYFRDAAELLEPYIINTIEYLNNAYEEGKTILIEGAQGTHLDLDMGTYPYVTSSSTTSGGASTGLGIAPNRLSGIVGIVKAYTTRVGSGPFPTELGNIEGEMLRQQGGEFGATTGRPRRCGWFDATVVKNAITINGITSLCLTKLDVLSRFKTIKIAVRYTREGDPMPYLPASLEALEKVEVDYEEMPGWDADISKARSFKALPKNCQAYVNRLEEILKTPINFIGVGMHRDEMIYR